MALDGFIGVKSVPLALKVLAEIKATIFYKAFCHLIL